MADEQNFARLEAAADILAKALKNGRKVLVCGNGGSTCDAMHFAQELTGRYRHHRKALPAIALSDPSHLSCVGNDYGFEQVFARGVEAYGQQGDVFIGISTSGNSENVLLACEKARQLNLSVLLLLGRQGGRLKGKGDIEWMVPGQTADRIQEIHMIVLHCLVELTERILFPSNYTSNAR
ncbi:MAG: D-sedoheptulose 7-phosphate isomerase [Bacteroidetes bacterium]|nr:MAG: D-sedoheptulose 7-phosphate isomerase [Bacteroidota bacterium]